MARNDFTIPPVITFLSFDARFSKNRNSFIREDRKKIELNKSYESNRHACNFFTRQFFSFFTYFSMRKMAYKNSIILDLFVLKKKRLLIQYQILSIYFRPITWRTFFRFFSLPLIILQRGDSGLVFTYYRLLFILFLFFIGSGFTKT